MAILDYVLWAQARGLHVFPLDEGDKRPLTLPSGGRLKWGSRASLDQDAARRLWGVRPLLNYGIAAKTSGLLVIDCDMGDRALHPLPARLDVEGVNCGEDAFAQISILLDEPFPCETLMVGTPKGGAHYYYTNPERVQMTQSSLVRGWIDVRSNGGTDGGYVVGPGSVVDGRQYKVLTGFGISAAPPWLLEMCLDAPPARRTPPPGLAPPGGGIKALADAWGASASGNQNNMLHWAACAAAKDGVPVSEAVSAFYDRRPPSTRRDEWNYRDVEATVRSGYRTVGAAIVIEP